MHGGETRGESDLARPGPVDGEGPAVDVVVDRDRRAIADCHVDADAVGLTDDDVHDDVEHVTAGVVGHVVGDRFERGTFVAAMVEPDVVECRVGRCVSRSAPSRSVNTTVRGSVIAPRQGCVGTALA
jgi:hypothetical protein